MKVLQLGPYPPPHGGIQTHLAALVELLRARGVSCDVLNLTRFRRPSENGIYYPPNSAAVVQHLLSHRYDIIHLHIGGRIWPRQLGLALLCCSLPGTKCVFTFHSGGYPSSPEGRSAHPLTLRAMVFRRFDLLIAVNEEIAKFFAQVGVPAERVRVISPAFVAVANSNEQIALPNAIEEFAKNHRPLLTSVGLLEPEYDLSLQMRALEAIRRSHPQAGLLIIGSGSLESELREQASRLPYADHILLSGDVAHASTLRLMQRSDCILRTTWYDGDALSVREALQVGVPVIASDNKMRPEGVTLIPARDMDALVQAVEETLARPPGLRVAAQPASNRNLEEVLKAYESLLRASERS